MDGELLEDSESQASYKISEESVISESDKPRRWTCVNPACAVITVLLTCLRYFHTHFLGSISPKIIFFSEHVLSLSSVFHI